MLEKVKNRADRCGEALIIVFLIIIMIIYLCCVCGWDREEILYYIYPEMVIKGLMLVCAYLAWKSYKNKTSPAYVCILFSTVAVILPFVTDYNRNEMLLEFCWCLWPAPVVYFADREIQKLSKNKTLVCFINTSIIALLSAAFHRLAKISAGNGKIDFCIPVLWIVQGLIWTILFCFSRESVKRKRNIVMAWYGCLLLFMLFTFADVWYFLPGSIWQEVRGRYWNEVIYLAWPILVFFLWRGIDAHICKTKSCYVQKIILIYFTMALLLIYVITRLDLNWEVSCYHYDIAKMAFCLFMAELVMWKELYQKLETVGLRIRLILFMALVNIGIFLALLIENERLREITGYLYDFLAGSGQADWIAYRKAAFSAFIMRDVSVLDNLYKKEAYWKVLSSHGIAKIWFDVGILPVLLMAFFVVLIAVLLWDRSREDKTLNQYAGYLAVSYMLKMGIAVFLQANLVASMHLEFPFTGQDLAESFVLVLFICAEGRKAECLQSG